jgi:hypothetical protein
VNADSLPKGGQDAIRRILFNHNGGTKTLLDLIKEKNIAQGKTPATRADLRFGHGPEGQIYLLNKRDGAIRLVVADAARSNTATQGAAGAAAAWRAPRTADGQPDIQGMYNVETITPVERPAGVKSLVLTREEAAALEAYEKQRVSRSAESSDPNRAAPPVGGETSQPKSYQEFLFRAGGGAVGGYNDFWLAMGERVVTINGEKRSSLIIDPPDGRVPPMKPEARERNAAFLKQRVSPDAAESGAGGPAGSFDGPELRPLAERCILGFGSTSGPPTLPNYFYNNLKQIVQTKDAIMILNEMIHDVRVIRLNGTHPPASVRRWMGDSIGRWEGETLVVETTNFTDKTQFRGSGANLKVIERFTKVDANTLLYRFTVEDPSTWDRSWTGEYPWVGTSEQMYEYACHEGNHSLANILRGARVADQNAPKKP